VALETGDDAYSFLSSVNHQPRGGTISNLNPDFATKLAASIREARNAGLNVGIASGFRPPDTLKNQGRTGPAASFDAAGNSLHTYGMAVDVDGIGQPGSDTAQKWYDIATRNGIYNPYGVGNASEWNHYQALPYKNLSGSDRDQLFAAYSSGDQNSVWKLGSNLMQGGGGGGGPSRPGTTTPATGGPAYAPAAAGSIAEHVKYIYDYAKQIGYDPNTALAIANAEGLKAWSATNPNAASAVDVSGGQPFSFGDFQLNVHPGAMGAKALAAGIDPRDPKQWQAADRFALDQMKTGGLGPWSGDPAAKAILAGGKPPDMSNLLTKYSVDGTTINTSGGPTPVAGGPSAPPATGQPGQPSGGLAGSLPGFQAGSPGAKMTAAGLQSLAGQGAGGGGQPPPMPSMQLPQAQAVGGPMMLGPGGQNVPGRSSAIAQNTLAQLAALSRGGAQPLAPGSAPGQATGIPGLPGTTLNSPSQLQMALMTGAMSPYDLYANAGLGGGFGTGSS
jgi:hypothetical protein